MKKLMTSLLLIGSLLPFFALAQTGAPVSTPTAGEKYQAGKHYQVIAVPVRTSNQEKIEVNEVFWYGCPHCYHFEAVIEPWAKKLPADVYFERTPAVWRQNMEPHARAYYSAKQLNLLDSMHMAIFKAMQDGSPKLTLSNEDQVAAFFMAHSVDEAAIRKAYNSFSVQSQTRQADARVRSYGIEGTPEVIVNGKYRISTNSAGSQEAVLDVANFLIEKERKAKSSK